MLLVSSCTAPETARPFVNQQMDRRSCVTPATPPCCTRRNPLRPSARQLCLEILCQPKMLKNRGQRLGCKLLQRRVLARPDLPLQQLRGFLVVLDLAINVGEIERTTTELLEVGAHALVLLIEGPCRRGIGLLGQAHQLVIGFGVVLDHPPRKILDRSGLTLSLGQTSKLNLSHAPDRCLVDE